MKGLHAVMMGLCAAILVIAVIALAGGSAFGVGFLLVFAGCILMMWMMMRMMGGGRGGDRRR